MEDRRTLKSPHGKATQKQSAKKIRRRMVESIDTCESNVTDYIKGNRNEWIPLIDYDAYGE